MKKLCFLLLCTFQMLVAMDQSLPEGIYVASLMPMRADLSCDIEELTSHCFDMIGRGCKGVALFGTTGEGPSFSLAERVDVLEKVVAAGFPAQKIIVANGSSGISETVLIVQAALKHGCAALLIAPPSFYKNVSDEGVIAYYREIIQRVDDPKLRVLLYHIPQFSGVPITLPVIEALVREFPNVVFGMKESEGNLALTKAVLKAFPKFQVFVGNERQIIEAVHDGAAGSICGLGNLYPELMCSLYEKGKQGSLANPPEIDAIFEALKGLPFVAVAKAWMENKRGPAWHVLRPPLMPLDANQKGVFLSHVKN